jgi:putative membrane protein
MVSNRIGDLAAEPLHGGVIEIERGRRASRHWREVAVGAYDVSHPVQFVSGHPATSSLSAVVLTRTEAIVLLIVGALALIVSGIGPADRTTWWLEVFPIFIAVPVLLATSRTFPFTRLVYWLVLVHAMILMLGGHYTYAQVPLGFWMQDVFGFTRNHYDRIGHFAQGFVPALVAREILLRRSPLTRGKWLFVIVTGLCLAISACYEFVEWGAALAGGSSADAFLGTQGDVWDTQWDMFMALIGALTAQLTLAGVQDRQLASFVSFRTSDSRVPTKVGV